MESKLALLEREEEKLKLVLKVLKKSFRQAGKTIRENDEEIGKLTRRILKLKERTCPQLSNFTEGLNVSQILGGTDAELILPEEVWKMILGNVKDPNDLWSCSNTCQLFDSILASWKTGWLLEQALPHLYRHLPGPKFLKCRLVCKSWSSAIDRFVEDHSSLLPHNDNRDPRNMNSFVYPIKEKRLCRKNMIKFGNLFVLDDPTFPGIRNANPFLGRYLIVEYSCFYYSEYGEDEAEKWFQKLYNFLESFGKEIWYFSIYFQHDCTPMIEQKIAEVFSTKLFSLLPNVRKVSAGVMSFNQFNRILMGEEEHPSLPKLETLEELNCQHQFPIFDAIVQRVHKQLVKIKLRAQSWSRVSHLEWTNLVELQLRFDWMRGEDEIADLRGQITPPNIIKLGIIWDGHDFTSPGTIEFINLVATRTRLSTVRLEATGNMFFNQELAPVCFASPAIKTLEIVHEYIPAVKSSCIYSFDFLARRFPFVENVHVISTGYAAGYNCPEISFASREDIKRMTPDLVKHERIVKVNRYLFEGEMHKSNIWKLLPRLKVFSSLWDVFTRENYEVYKKNQNLSSKP